MNLEEAVAWYRRDVIPNFPTYTESTRRFADLVVLFDASNPTAIFLIASGIRKILTGRKACKNGGESVRTELWGMARPPQR